MERCAQLIADVTGARVSPGWVSSVLSEAAALVADSITVIRALRPVKTKMKISGCHQSEDGAAHWLTVRSYLDSARNHGLSALEAILRAFTGNLWMPPVALDA
ncbi:hypothetical protein ABGB14_28750 [Nonomuraea sp. B10E15]|uniref:hypothetical protein n=1 Tax=Nonomuraea sp. B10E15 TaxID=3153560 RepID=UPI00325D4312